MINGRAFALVSLLLASPAFAVSTAKFTLNSASWTDLGAGPLLLSFTGSGVFAIGDAAPVIPLSEGFTMIAGESVNVSTTSHVWAMAKGAPSANAYVAPISP